MSIGDNARDPVFSPDGQWLAWWGARRGEPPQIYVKRLSGGDTVAVHEGIAPAWSPDGSRIAFVSGASGTLPRVLPGPLPRAAAADVYTYDLSTGRLLNLTPDPSADLWPAWSPDGSRIAFGSDREGGRPEVYVMDADGSDVRRVTHNDLDEAMLAWVRPPSRLTPDDYGPPGQPPPDPATVLARGEPVGFKVCWSAAGWTPLSEDEIRDAKAQPALRGYVAGLPKQIDRAFRARLHYNQAAYPFDNAFTPWENVVAVLARREPYGEVPVEAGCEDELRLRGVE